MDENIEKLRQCCSINDVGITLFGETFVRDTFPSKKTR